MRGAGGTSGGGAEFFIGFVMTSLFNTILMLVLLAGGIGLVFRGLQSHGPDGG
jgi:hypothetical protein